MRRPRNRRRRATLLVACTALAILASWHYVSLYRHATAARDALTAIEGATAVGLDVGAEEIDRIEAQLVEAEAHIDRARSHLRWDPVLHGARWTPVTGDQVIAADAFLDAADHLVAAGREATALAREAVAIRADADGEPLTASAFTLLDTAGPALARIERHVEAAVTARRAIGDRALLGPLDDARARLDEQLPRIEALVRHGVEAHAILPGLMGFEGERRYLLLSLNNAELMPGGGLVTAAGILAVRDGSVVETTFRNTAAWLPTYLEGGGDFIPAPEPLQRHLLKEYPWNLGVSNWDPDFPTWARQALEFYELAWGPQDVDGIVAVDLDVLEALLALTGAQTVEAPGFGLVRLTSENAVMELERVTRAPSDTWRRSKEAVGALQEALLRDIVALPASRWDDLAAAVRALGDERHLQVLLFDERAQDLVAELGWDGSLRGGDRDSDFLHLSEASVNSTKLNLVFSPEATYEIDVGPLGDARHRLVLHYENTVPEWAEGRDPDLVSHLMFDGQYGGYIRAFVPGDATAFVATADGRATSIEDVGGGAAHQWFGVYLPVPPGASRELVLEWTVPLATSSPDAYAITLQKQPGTDGLCVALSVRREGTEADLHVDGGTTDREGRTCLTTDATVTARFAP